MELTPRDANRLRWRAVFAAACVASACQTARTVSQDVPTLAIEDFAFDVERHRGRTVRACGRLVQIESRWAVEHVPRPGEVYFHGAPAVFLVPCAGQPPRLDSDGCITGQVARQDGSLAAPAQRTDMGDAPYDYDWFLHPQCRAQR